MKSAALISLLAAMLMAQPARAADCGSAAQAACAQVNCTQVLSVRSDGGACVVTLLVPGRQGEPPRKQTVRVGG